MLNLEGTYETQSGIWHATNMHEPKHNLEQHEEEHYVRFKWQDPNDPTNPSTPGRLLRLTISEPEVMQYGEPFERRLKAHLTAWLGTLEFEIRFSWDEAIRSLKVKYMPPS